MYDVYDETDLKAPQLLFSSPDPEVAKDYAREAVDRAKVTKTLVVRKRGHKRGRLIFITSSESSRMWINTPGGMCIQQSSDNRGVGGGPLQVNQPGMGSAGYSFDVLKVRFDGDRSGRRENDQEIEQDHGPQKSTPECERWNEGQKGERK